MFENPFIIFLQRFGTGNVPPGLRRALLCCVAALAGALSLGVLSAAGHTEAQAERNDAQSDIQKVTMQLAAARETESARAARTKRFALVRTALENGSDEKPEWEQLTARLSAHPHIAEPSIKTQPAEPVFSAPRNVPLVTLQRVHIEAGLLHEEALLALDAIATGSPAHAVPTGCSLRRESNAAPVTLHARCEFDRIALAPPPGIAP